MRQRLISAAVLVPVVVVVFLVGEPLISLAILLLAIAAAAETSKLIRLAGLDAPAWLAILGAVAAVIITPFVIGPFSRPDVALPLALGFLAIVVMATALVSFASAEPSEGVRRWAGSLLAVLYPSLLGFVLAVTFVAPQVALGSPLANVLDAGRVWLLILVLTVWSLDTFAYLTGRAYPRGQMAPRISPNKTWSGAIGGTVAAVVVCAALVWAAGQHPLGGAALGLIIAVAAQLGDLAESLLKRAAAVKDSGNLLPGHGGVLDRVDSFVFAAPAMFVALTWVQLLAVSRPA